MKYSEVSDQYKKISKNQASAGEKLISLIHFRGDESILDLGCGTGHLAFELSKKTHGTVIGIDPSEGMLQKARESYGDLIKFNCQSGEEMSFISKFDIVFCNSVFHWFKKPELVLKKINTALIDNGMFALQTPVRQWCAFITDAIDQTCRETSIKTYMDHYKNPWFHLENAQEYREFLENAGFKVSLFQDETVSTLNCDLEKILGLFNSGPALAYLNPDNYSIQWQEGYEDKFIMTLRDIIKKNMSQSETINISYNRAFLISRK